MFRRNLNRKRKLKILFRAEDHEARALDLISDDGIIGENFSKTVCNVQNFSAKNRRGIF